MSDRYTNHNPLEYITKDNSLIRELLNPKVSPDLSLSLAEAVVEAGASTIEHIHTDFDEIYYCLEGSGFLFINGEAFAFEPGDFYLLPKLSRHYLRATSQLKLLCICQPAYNHSQTELLR